MVPSSTILRNRYQIIEHLGGGSFGDTYLATDLDLPGKPHCVVKHLQPKNPRADLSLARRWFDTEAKVLYNLGHQCQQIPTLFAHLEENGEFYLVQEFIDGHDLKTEIVPGNKLSESEVITLLKSILEVLAVAHEHQPNAVIHRDIKPANLMRRRQDGKIILIDFGAVKEINQLIVKANGDVTTTVPIGTPGYMPTEQAKGKPQLCSDVYAVGMIGIQALTGIQPHNLPDDPSTGEVSWRHLVPRVDPKLADVLDRMVRDNFSNRYQNAGEALQALLFLSQPSGTPALKTWQFQTVTVNSTGQITNRRQGEVGVFTENIGNGVTLDMVAIPGGSFVMGSPTSEAERMENEGPPRTVNISPFFMGKYPVTQEQYQAVMGNNPSIFQGFFKSKQLPVEQVTWDKAVEFCHKLSQKTGKTYRLPSEAEWEYACRAGTTTPFYFGETITPDLVNYDGNYPYGAAPKGLDRDQTTDVGSFGPNAFGLYDMHGNVWEWCSDKWHDNYNGAPTDGSSWETGTDNNRVLRGGSCFDNAVYCRSALRVSYSGPFRLWPWSFRVALASVSSPS
jgi:formylglycine-generating enzyme required for sulfatase activity/tRNA A-37 threonylcarbamoyl transferase component Bud32